MTESNGKLYVVATPIGNLSDLSSRAVEVLKQADIIAAEDTRRARRLLEHYGIAGRPVSLHEHNEDKAASRLLGKLLSGQSAALVSDAGTPLISDPGLPLVRMAREAGIAITPIPGPCALIAALSVSGLAVDRFSFEGFPPRTSAARQRFFSEKRDETGTWIFYESSHRILEAVRDLAEVLPGERKIVIARELTKLHETIIAVRVRDAAAMIESDENMQKGEFVVVVEGATGDERGACAREQERVLRILLKECSLKTAVAMAVEIAGGRKKELYQMALAIAEEKVN
ncbi:MAG: 16S rRNA (cytidine(1402)-2'-O)-methyltransferase [Gammaproteobacteria bacterium]